MLPYILVFALLVFFAYFNEIVKGANLFNKLLLGVLALFVGLRHEVGGDWDAYLRYVDLATEGAFLEVLFLNDPAYMLLNYLVGPWGRIQAVNFFCAFIAILGIWRLSKLLLRNPLWGMVLSFPYHIMVVAMGYTRQGVALGALCYATATFIQNRPFRSFMWLILGIGFHRTLLFILPGYLLSLLLSRRFGWYLKTAISLLTLSVVLPLILFYQQHVSGQTESYIVEGMSSSGATIRLALWLPALIGFLFYLRRLSTKWPVLSESEKMIWSYKWLWTYFLLIYALSLVLLPTASTFADRMTLYTLPLMLISLRFLQKSGVRVRISHATLKLGLVVYALFIQLGWLTLAEHRFSWIPYKMWPFID